MRYAAHADIQKRLVKASEMGIVTCFPDKNEEMLAACAKEKGYNSILFIYKKNIPKLAANFPLLVYKGLFGKNSRIKFSYLTEEIIKNSVVIYSPSEKSSFTSPAKGITQVLIKELKEKKCILGLSYRDILNTKRYPENIEKLMFVVKLCNKYNVSIFLDCFAYSPEQIIWKNEIDALAGKLRIKNNSGPSSFLACL